MENLKVLIVEDDERIRDLLRMYLENENFVVDDTPTLTPLSRLIKDCTGL